MKKNYKSLGQYLNYYYTYCQKDIVVVHRGDTKEGWAKRCKYLDPDYQPLCPYNHRTVLDCEVVIEYDYDNVELNKKLVNLVCDKLKKDKIEYAKWFSGNKSSHLHFMIKAPSVKNLSLLKNTIMKYYGTFYRHEPTGAVYNRRENAPEEHVVKLLPDLRLSSPHLIRAEYGVHEKTQLTKKLINKTPNYPVQSILPNEIWAEYEKAQKFSMSVRMGMQTKDHSQSDVVKKLLDTVQFKKNMDDGRERLVFMLTHILKPKYKNKDELGDFLWEWYHYSGGYQLSEQQVRSKVNYHWFKDYSGANWTYKMNELYDELVGRE